MIRTQIHKHIHTCICTYGGTQLQRRERDWIFCVVITKENIAMANSEELNGTGEYLTFMDEVSYKSMSL